MFMSILQQKAFDRNTGESIIEKCYDRRKIIEIQS